VLVAMRLCADTPCGGLAGCPARGSSAYWASRCGAQCHAGQRESQFWRRPYHITRASSVLAGWLVGWRAMPGTLYPTPTPVECCCIVWIIQSPSLIKFFMRVNPFINLYKTSMHMLSVRILKITYSHSSISEIRCLPLF